MVSPSEKGKDGASGSRCENGAYARAQFFLSTRTARTEAGDYAPAGATSGPALEPRLPASATAPDDQAGTVVSVR
jgi:hypothetical protein